ncbi:MAG: histidinol dehydrogenase, partial [Dehalococcoidia bacterium]|nr:histidinol dehydrogenase [Dehalococcoidia bacterium]
MRILYGLEAGRALLRRREWRPEAGPEALARLSDLFGREVDTEEAVRLIVRDVQARGDSALVHYAKSLDGVQLEELEVPRRQIESARNRVEPKVMKALEMASERIRSFHQRQKSGSWADLSEGYVGQIIRPLERVGIYAPGGRASYPSTVLMTAIPAKVAGVPQVVLATPPQRAGDVSPLI